MELQAPSERNSGFVDRAYAARMTLEDQERLAGKGDMGLAASARRLRAARYYAGLLQKDVADAAGVKTTTLNNMERASSYPNRAVLKYFFRAHRVDFNFMMHGDFAQLPADVQPALFAALERVDAEWDRADSGQAGRKSSSAPKGKEAEA